MWFVFDILHQINFFLIAAMMLFATIFNHDLGKDTKFPPFLLMIIPLFICLVQISVYIYLSKIAALYPTGFLNNDDSIDFLMYFSSFFSNALICLFLLGTLRFIVVIFDVRERTERVLFWVSLLYVTVVFVGNVLFLWNESMENPLMLSNQASWEVLPFDSIVLFVPGLYAIIRLISVKDRHQEPEKRKYLRAVAVSFLPVPVVAAFDIVGIDNGHILPPHVPFRTSFIPFTIFVMWTVYRLMQDKVERTRPMIDTNDQKKALIHRYGISDRELDIIEQVAQGNPNKVIAEVLFISENTVKTHIKSIYRKLEISNRIQLLKLLEKLKTHR